MTINSPAAVIWAMYLAVAEQQGAAWSQLSGTLQNDILKEYIAQKEYIYPPRDVDAPGHGHDRIRTRAVPRFNPISISGYHIREAGSTAVQELAFTLRDGIEYVEWALARGLPVDSLRRRASASSSTRITISSKRSPSTAPRAASGRMSCATASARETSAA